MQTQADTLYLQIANDMAGLIRAGTLSRGERIPSVRTLAQQHGVSQSTVVQAYRTLEDARLIEARPRSGYFVTARPPRLPEPDTSKPPVDAQSVGMSAMAAQMLALAHDPAYTSFGAACPAPDLFDQERVRRAMTRATQRHRQSLCQYPSGHSDETLRRAIARHAMRMGCSFDAEGITVTNSCLESITLCLRAVTQPGDVVALESPTYYGFLQILEHLGLRALEIPTHPRTGLSLDALQFALDTQPIKAVLCVPTLSNPIGSSMPPSERKRLAQLLGSRSVPLIEDVLYNDLCEEDDKRRAVKAYDTHGVVMVCGSFSKTIAPGLRLGWVEAGRWTEHLRQIKAATCGSQAVVLERAMADLLTQPGIEAGYRQLRNTVAARVDEARGLVAQHFPKGTRVTDPAGGFILWLELPAQIDSLALCRAALAERICFAPGTMFSATDRFRHCLRLGLGGQWGKTERQALKRLGELARAMA